MADIGNNHVEDYEQIKTEWREELEMKAKIPAEAKAEVEEKTGEPTETIKVEENNPNTPKVNNSDKGKSITE